MARQHAFIPPYDDVVFLQSLSLSLLLTVNNNFLSDIFLIYLGNNTLAVTERFTHEEIFSIHFESIVTTFSFQLHRVLHSLFLNIPMIPISHRLFLLGLCPQLKMKRQILGALDLAFGSGGVRETRALLPCSSNLLVSLSSHRR